jgi:hypothetical protein
MPEVVIREQIPLPGNEVWQRGSSWAQRMHWIMRCAASAPRTGPGRFRDRETRRRRFPFRYSGCLVTLAEHNHPYGRTMSGRGYLTHIVDELYLVWYAGQVVDSAVRWRCGATSRYYNLVDEPESTMCVACPLNRPSYERV